MAKVNKAKKVTKKKSVEKKKKTVSKKKKAVASHKTIKKKSPVKKNFKKNAAQKSKVKSSKKQLKKVVKQVKKKAPKNVKSNIKKTIKKVKAAVKKVVKKVAPSKSVKGTNIKAVKPSAELKKDFKKIKTPATNVTSAIGKKPILIKGKPVIQPAKVKIDQEEKLHSKSQRIMKELEETMDMEKVKPRIKVPAFLPPKPKPAPVIKLVEPVNTKKEKYQLEFEFRSSKSILFSYLSDSSGMAEWFADEVRSSDHNYTFVWDKSEVHAKLVAVKDNLLVRFQWTDENDGTYFQFEIKEDDITSDIALLITDWANPGEKESNARLWESQIQTLRQLIGSV